MRTVVDTNPTQDTQKLRQENTKTTQLQKHESNVYEPIKQE